MGNTLFYQCALNRPLKERTKEIFELLLEINKTIDEMVLVHDSHVEAGKGGGAAPEVIREQLRHRSAEANNNEEIRRAEGTLKTLVTLITSEKMLIASALQAEEIALKYERESYGTGDPVEMRWGRGIIKLREGNVRTLTTFRANDLFGTGNSSFPGHPEWGKNFPADPGQKKARP